MAPTSGPPNIMDIENGRRAGTLQDFCNLMKLCRTSGSYRCWAARLSLRTSRYVRHLEVMRAQLLLTDKIPFIFSRGRQQIADNFALLQIAHGLSGGFAQRPCTYTVINTNSPLRWISHVRGHRRVRVGWPAHNHHAFTLAGAMAPVTIAGADDQRTPKRSPA
jgi:trimethylamine--corrinoid protein Co-methyltransferase